MTEIRHVILTRFNLPTGGAEGLIRAQEGWLRQRVELFERFCLPSVAAQTDRSFRWLLYFDPESPDWLRQHIDGWSQLDCFRPMFRAEVPPEQLLADLTAVVGRPGSHLITTNLDNDDGLARDFVERLHQLPAPDRATAVYLVNGIIRTPAAVYLRRDRVNAFCSVSEPWSLSPQTCWADWHNLLGRRMPVQGIGGEPAWLQVIHETNVSNRVRGRLVSPERYRSLFVDGLEGIAEPGRLRLLADAHALRPARDLRDLARTGSKNLALRLLGKDGLDRVKLALRRGK